MKKIMILGAGVYQFPLIKYASKYTVVLVAPVITEEFLKLADTVYYCDLRDMETILKIAMDENIDGIITDQTDIPVRTMAYVAEKMGLPGNSYETACIFTDKNKMRERIKELGLPYIPYENVKNIDDAIIAAEKIGYPIIIKPVDNQGSRGVFRIDNILDLKEKFDASIGNSSKKEVLVEKYIEGKEAVVEGLVYNNKYRSLICGDTIYFDMENVFAAKKRLFPSRLSEKIKDKILDLNKKIIEGFGLKQGITHSEFIICGEDVYLIETAARGGGVFISSDLIPLRTGLCTEEFLLDISLGNKPKINIKDTNKVCCYIAFFLPCGTVTKIEGVEKVFKMPFVHNNLLNNLKIGLKTSAATDKTTRFSIIVSADNYDELDYNIDMIKSTLNVEVQTIKGTEGIIWD